MLNLKSIKWLDLFSKATIWLYLKYITTLMLSVCYSSHIQHKRINIIYYRSLGSITDWSRYNNCKNNCNFVFVCFVEIKGRYQNLIAALFSKNENWTKSDQLRSLTAEWRQKREKWIDEIWLSFTRVLLNVW